MPTGSLRPIFAVINIIVYLALVSHAYLDLTVVLKNFLIHIQMSRGVFGP